MVRCGRDFVSVEDGPEEVGREVEIMLVSNLEEVWAELTELEESDSVVTEA